MGHGSGIERVTVFYYHVRERYGMVEFDADMRVLSLEEKSQHPRSYYAVMGLYFYDSDWWASPARSVRSWGSGIMDVNNTYLTYLRARKPMWSDGTRHCMVDTGLMIRSWLRARLCRPSKHGRGSSPCLEEIVWRKGYI